MMTFCFLLTDLATFVKRVATGVGESVELLGGKYITTAALETALLILAKSRAHVPCVCTCRVTGAASVMSRLNPDGHQRWER